jgi:hypothetical protein
LIRRFSQPAPPSELPCGSLSRLVPKSRFTLRANLRLLYRAPAPALGCVHPSHPWLKKSICCANDSEALKFSVSHS